jgi:cell division protein FtsB
MYWLLLFLAVVAVWLLVLALLAKKLWGQGKALTRELVAAQSKLDAAQSAAGSGQTHRDERAPA